MVKWVVVVRIVIDDSFAKQRAKQEQGGARGQRLRMNVDHAPRAKSRSEQFSEQRELLGPPVRRQVTRDASKGSDLSKQEATAPTVTTVISHPRSAKAGKQISP